MRLLVCLLFLIPILALALPKESDRQYVDKARSIILNPGFEFQQARWSKTGSSTWAVDASTPLIGARSLQWDASTTGEYLQSAQVSIPVGLQGDDCQLSLRYSWASGSAGDIKLQVYDGTNVLVESELSPASTKENLQFTCPTSGTLGARLASTANAAAIIIDEVHLGASTSAVQLSQAELVAFAAYPGTTNCQWTRTSGSYGDFPVDTDCPSIIVYDSNYAVDTTDNDLPDIDFDSLPPGIYKVEAHIPAAQSTGTESAGFRISDGTTNGPACLTTESTNIDSATCMMTFTYTTAGARNFKIQAYQSGGNSAYLLNRNIAENLTFRVTRFPLGSEKAYNLSNQGWYVDATIGGAHFDLGTSIVSSWTSPTNGSETLTTNPGSAPVFIGCAGTEVASGSTCTGNEQPAISFTIPKTGAYEVCTQFAHFASCPSGSGNCDAYTSFMHGETANNSQTIITNGKVNYRSFTMEKDGTYGKEVSVPFSLCSNFVFSSVGQKTIRLFYKQAVGAAWGASLIIGTGDTLPTWTVKPINQAAATLTIEDAVLSPDVTKPVVRAGVFTPTSGAACTVGTDYGDWLGATTPNAAGDCTIAINSGVFNTTPVCTCTVRYSGTGSNEIEVCRIVSVSSTSIRIRSNYFSTTTPTDGANPVHLICYGTQN